MERNVHKIILVLLFLAICGTESQIVVTCASAIQAQKWSSLYGTGIFTIWAIFNTLGTVGPITITTGSSVILDVPIVTINGGITIQAGGNLYFDWQQSITVTTPYILVQGTLWIGSESCPYVNKANILLVNDVNAADVVIDSATVGR
jgi:hypothetical protein